MLMPQGIPSIARTRPRLSNFADFIAAMAADKGESMNPLFGVIFHALGGIAAGSFYAPLKKVRGWAWESFWLVMGIAAWLVVPWFIAWLTIPNLLSVLGSSPAHIWGLCILFGALWGLGSMAYGLSVRYMGMALGCAIALGFCMTFGTLVPPVFLGFFGTEEHWANLVSIFTTAPGLTVLVGIGVCLGGIAMCGLAGIRKEKELTEQQQKEAVEEFSLGKGFVIAVAAGILSACFAFGISVGEPIATLAVEGHGAAKMFSKTSILVVILIGGFSSNAICCIWLNLKNNSYKDYVTGPLGEQIRNYFFSVLGGTTWYFQFFFYGIGTTFLGKEYEFASWSIHMAFIIAFSNFWGIIFREWEGTSGRTKALVWAGILTLIASTIVIGFANYIK